MLGGFVRWGKILLALCVVVGCSSLTTERRQEDVVKQRGIDRWAALIEGKMETAYTFETPEYRELYTFSDFRKKTPKGAGAWQKATVENVACDVEKCSVEMRIYVNMKFGLAFKTIETNGLIKENWVRSTNGQWYHVSDH